MASGSDDGACQRPPLANGKTRIDFQTEPSRYRHWKLTIDGDVATLVMDVDEKAGLFEGYELKLNSYDLGVDIELADAHRAAALRASAGARGGAALGQAAGVLRRRQYPHAGRRDPRPQSQFLQIHQRDAQRHRGSEREFRDLKSICAINGTAAGGGYELALATDYIMLVDDGSASVSLPELPLLAVLPGTGGLTRVSDKRKVRRDHADVFCTTEEGVKGKRAVEWRLVDDVVPGSKFDDAVLARAKEFAAKSPRNGAGKGITLTPLTRTFAADGIEYGFVSVEFQRAERIATITLRGPSAPPPASADAMLALGADFWPLQLARELDDAILNIRLNELDIAAIVFKSSGDPAAVLAYDAFLDANKDHWLAREIRLLWKRVLKRVDLTSRSLVTLIEPGSCFAGTLAELPLASDRSYMLIGNRDGDNKPPATIALADVNFGAYPMSNGLTRLACRFLATPESIDAAKAERGKMLDAETAQDLGLITFALDDIDWDDEVRVFLEERASFSPDGLTGLEANLRFAGPETMESKIFARLTAWQNWIFQRPNAIGEEGALKRYGTGQKPVFDTRRV